MKDGQEDLISRISRRFWVLMKRKELDEWDRQGAEGEVLGGAGPGSEL